MYKQIDSNKAKTWALVTFFLALIIGFGWFLSYYYSEPGILLFAVIFSIVQSFVGYFYSDKIALAVSGAQELKRSEAKELFQIVENLCITAGIPEPKLYVINDSAPNAFATGRDPKHASIAVTNGLLEKLNKTELQGVLAHELSHVTNYDIRLTSIVVVLVGIIALASDWMLRMMWWGGRDRDREGSGNGLIAIIGLVLAILAPIAATLIQLAVSRKREFLADASGALLTRYPEGLASALEKIAKDKEPLEVANKATAHMYFENPLKDYSGKINNLFSTHPPVEERIKALRNMT